MSARNARRAKVRNGFPCPEHVFGPWSDWKPVALVLPTNPPKHPEQRYRTCEWCGAVNVQERVAAEIAWPRPPRFFKLVQSV